MESYTRRPLHKPTSEPNTTEHYAKLLLGTCAAAVRVSRETFVFVTSNGHFADLIFPSHDRHSLATCFSAWGPGESHFETETTSLQQESCLCVQGEAKHYPLLWRNILWGCWLLLSTGWNQLSFCMCYVVCSSLTELCPPVLSKKVVGRCCLAETGKWVMAINIVFRIAWLTRRLKQEVGGANSTTCFGSWKHRRTNASSPNPTTCCLRQFTTSSMARGGPDTWRTMNFSSLGFFTWGDEEKSDSRE